MASVAVAGRIDASTKAEVVGAASSRSCHRGPVIADLASAVELLIGGSDIPAPHKE